MYVCTCVAVNLSHIIISVVVPEAVFPRALRSKSKSTFLLSLPLSRDSLSSLLTVTTHYNYKLRTTHHAHRERTAIKQTTRVRVSTVEHVEGKKREVEKRRRGRSARLGRLTARREFTASINS